MATIRPASWELVLLRQNPFPTVPPLQSEEAVWAGFGELKRQLEEILLEATATSRTQVVLNWGDLGSGKTHAAVYYGIPGRMPKALSQSVKDVHILYIRTPKEADKAEQQFYQSIIDAARFRRLRAIVTSVVQDLGRQESLQAFQHVARSEALGRAIWLMGLEQAKSGMLRLFEEGQIAERDEWSTLIEAYFYSQTTRADLRKLGISRGIENASDRFQVLSGLLNVMIGLGPTEALHEHSRVILWIDEMEDLVYYPTRSYRPFTQGLRDLVDRLPSYFTVFMNFTLASPEAVEDATTVLGKTVMDRVTNNVYFRELDVAGMVGYVIELLRQYRTEDPIARQLPETYPFTPDALTMVIDSLPSGGRTPRDINNRCADIISKAIQRNIIRAPGVGIIDQKLVTDLESERTELDLGESFSSVD